jgi:protein involved in polysaccharide export with SLBB domain
MKKIKYFVFIMLLCSISVYSQLPSTDKNKTDLNQQQNRQFNLQAPTIDVSGFDILKQLEPSTSTNIFNDQLMEGPVALNKYIVGPNDIFSLGIWSVINQALPLSVTPEGSLIIPSVGEVSVSGLTLVEAKEKVISKVRGRYISGEITLTLVNPRRFIVTVTGVGQGKYPMSAVMRSSGLLNFILSDSLSLMRSGTSPGERSRFSLRKITVNRKNGQVLRIDLHKYFATQDDKYNPYLMEGDVVNIPKYDIDGVFIAVDGAVQFPGVFEYVEGDDLETALQLVRGVTTSANLDSVMISRLDAAAKIMTNIYVKYEENKHMPLQINDRVYVLSKFENRRDYKVTILGEVNRPGPYPITENSTKLSEIILMSGGLKPNAYLPTSELYRRIDTFFITTKNRDTTENLFTQRLNDVISNKDEKEYFDLENKAKIGHVNVDFEKLAKGDLSQDVVLRNGDIIYISDNKKQVYVYGQVNKPGYVIYKEGADYSYYIDKAGGYGERADEDEVRIIKFKTREWQDPDEAKVESNDFVYVPKLIKRDFAYDIDLIAKVSSVLVSVITLTLLVIQSQK